MELFIKLKEVIKSAFGFLFNRTLIFGVLFIERHEKLLILLHSNLGFDNSSPRHRLQPIQKFVISKTTINVLQIIIQDFLKSGGQEDLED